MTLTALEVSVRIKATKTWTDTEHDPYSSFSRTKTIQKSEPVEVVNLGADFESPAAVANVLRAIADQLDPAHTENAEQGIASPYLNPNTIGGVS